jgi:hypothetical protein
MPLNLSGYPLGNAGADYQEILMAIIGLLLVAAAAAFGIELVAMNDFSIEIDAFNQTYSTTTSLVFVAGVVTGLTAVLGIMLMRDGLVRRHRRRSEARQTERERERHIEALEQEHAENRLAEVDAQNGEHVDLRDRVHELDPDRDRVTTF